MKEEEWRDIEGHPGYQVSNKGQVRSVDRIIECKSRWGSTTTKNLKGKVLAQATHPKGYKHVNLGLEAPARRVSPLVAKAFLPNPKGYPIVDHIDNDQGNNAVENLRWMPPAANALNTDWARYLADLLEEHNIPYLDTLEWWEENK